MADPITLIVSALAAGAGVAGKELVSEVVKDAYAKLKSILQTRFGSKAEIAQAIQQLENRPNSDARQAVLKEELDAVGAANDTQVIAEAKKFVEILKQHGLISQPTYQAILIGSGAIAQGQGAVAAAAGGIAVGGSMQGNISTSGQASGEKEKS